MNDGIALVQLNIPDMTIFYPAFMYWTLETLSMITFSKSVQFLNAGCSGSAGQKARTHVTEG